MTVKQAVEYGFQMLRDSGVDVPYLDAVVLFSEASGMPKEKVYASFFETVRDRTLSKYTILLDRRTAGYPVSYIRGKKEFYGREFIVDPRVLVPRPDTETVVESALAVLVRMHERRVGSSPPEREKQGGEKASVLDLCCGSGCVAVTLAAECGSLGIPAEVSGSDISEKAGEVFTLNSRRILGKELAFIKSDLFADIEETFDLIVSNPPYLNAGDMEKLQQRRWPEPEIALFGGKDGLEIIRNIVKKGMEYLRQYGYLLLEAAPDQMDRIESFMNKEGFRHIFRRKDLGNRERVIGGSVYNS
jgi:release factor glutamine methyltransferase